MTWEQFLSFFLLPFLALFLGTLAYHYHEQLVRWIVRLARALGMLCTQPIRWIWQRLVSNITRNLELRMRKIEGRLESIESILGSIQDRLSAQPPNAESPDSELNPDRVREPDD